MTLTSAERLDGARDQCQRFLGPASEGIGGTEGCGDLGYLGCAVSETSPCASQP